MCVISGTLLVETVSNTHKARALAELEARFGAVKKLDGSQSLFSIGQGDTRLYLRYSKIHAERRSFFGLRDVDLRRLEGHDSYIGFILDDGSPPVFVPFADFEEVFRNSQIALDGQHKVQLLRGPQELESTSPARADLMWRRIWGLAPSKTRLLAEYCHHPRF